MIMRMREQVFDVTRHHLYLKDVSDLYELVNSYDSDKPNKMELESIECLVRDTMIRLCDTFKTEGGKWISILTHICDVCDETRRLAKVMKTQIDEFVLQLRCVPGALENLKYQEAVRKDAKETKHTIEVLVFLLFQNPIYRNTSNEQKMLLDNFALRTKQNILHVTLDTIMIFIIVWGIVRK